ncbi:kinase-like protein [Schizopora paradoxa]|uniref:Kinase-like protein n=1 Tax=Schizopora paradoxa TaxID=27342 RepID=A0A0H2R420_9AGAM|nr:kinase-like protein [Schizopora paradoxa]
MEYLRFTLLGLRRLDLSEEIVEQERDPIGSGGSSDVYRARSKIHNAVVAVKRLRTYILKDQVFAAKRLAREIKIWAELHHDYVLPLLGYYMTSDSPIPCLASEWSEHGTLHVFMKTLTGGGIEAYIMASRIAEGLSYLHLKGIIHADLNSHNILISRTQTPMIGDFGLSRPVAQVEDDIEGSFLSNGGTIRWMAKELLEISEHAPRHDERSDVWAFGMVVYELLSWKEPYYHLKEPQAALTIIDGGLPVKPKVSYFPKVFRVLWELCKRCWKERSSRPSAREIVDSLGRFPKDYRYRGLSCSSTSPANITFDAKNPRPAQGASPTEHYHPSEDSSCSYTSSKPYSNRAAKPRTIDNGRLSKEVGEPTSTDVLVDVEKRSKSSPLHKRGITQQHPNEIRRCANEMAHTLRQTQSFSHYLNKCFVEFCLEFGFLRMRAPYLVVEDVLNDGEACEKQNAIKAPRKLREITKETMVMAPVDSIAIIFW